VVPLFNITGQAKNTTMLNNSDVDITLRPWRIRHIGEPGTYQLGQSLYLYMTEAGGNFAAPGQGKWLHVQGPVVIPIPASAAVATAIDLVNAAGYGIEHMPEPAGFALLLAGTGLLVVGRLRRPRRR
jgi:hypothetical protein